MVDTLSNGFPNPTDAPANSQPLFLENNNYWPAVLGKDHQVIVGDNNTTQFEGRHIQVALKNRHGSPPNPSSLADGISGVLYADNGNMFYWPTFSATVGCGPYQLTTGSNDPLTNAPFGAANGWTMLPGNLIMQYGNVSPVVHRTSTAVNFPRQFPNNLFSLVLAGLRANHSGVDVIYIVSESTAGFNYFDTSNNGYDSFSWMAIGN